MSEGWAHLGGETPPPNVFLIGDTPHDWLFPRCRAVCHHGGAGTTAAGLRAGLPTVVVPFFGDQFFWGRMVAEAGAGPKPIPIARLDSDALTAAFEMCGRPEVRERAQALGAPAARDRRRGARRAVGIPPASRGTPCVARTDSDHLATVECIACGRIRLCPDCAKAHSSHLAVPCRYVDWDVRSTQGLVGGFGDLMGDAARAMLAGLDEIVSRVGS